MSTPVPHPSPQKEKEVDEHLAKLELGIEMLLTYFKPTVKLTNITPTKAAPQTPSKTSPQSPVKKYTEMLPKRISSPVKPILPIKIPENNVQSPNESGFLCFNNSPETEEDESFKEVKATVDNIINSGHLDADYDSDNQNLNYDNFKMKLRQRKSSNSSMEKVLQRKGGHPRKSKYVNIHYV